LEIRREDYDPETEWIRCSKLINVNAEALIDALRQSMQSDAAAQ